MKTNFIKVSFHDSDFGNDIYVAFETLSEMFYKELTQDKLLEAIAELAIGYYAASNILDNRPIQPDLNHLKDYIKHSLEVEFLDKTPIPNHKDVQIVYDMNLKTTYYQSCYL